VLLTGHFLDPVGLTGQFIQDSILAHRNAVHPPEARYPATEIKTRNPIERRHFR
jgi:hypothetical protein